MDNLWDQWAGYYANQDRSINYMEIGDFVEKIAPDASRVADMGCGAGGLVRHLAARGFTAIGLDSSKPMLDAARNSDIPDHARNRVTWVEGDMCSAPIYPAVDVILCVHSTFFSLLSQDEQIDFFKNAWSSLVPGGFVVLENYIPHDSFLFPAKGLEVGSVSPSGFGLQISAVNLATQAVTVQTVDFSSESGVSVRSLRQRYAWPEELKLLAQIGSFSVTSLFSDWNSTPINNKSMRSVLVFRKEG